MLSRSFYICSNFYANSTKILFWLLKESLTSLYILGDDEGRMVLSSFNSTVEDSSFFILLPGSVLRFVSFYTDFWSLRVRPALLLASPDLFLLFFVSALSSYLVLRRASFLAYSFFSGELLMISLFTCLCIAFGSSNYICNKVFYSGSRYLGTFLFFFFLSLDFLLLICTSIFVSTSLS